MDIFTSDARYIIRRTVASMVSMHDVAELDFLSDERIWVECWLLVEVASRTKDRMVSPASEDEPPLPLHFERLRAAFDVLSRNEEIFDIEARKHFALFTHCDGTRFKCDESGKLTSSYDHGKTWGESNDGVLWYYLADTALDQIMFSDDHGFWFRNCFEHLAAHGILPSDLTYEEKEDE